MKDFNIIYEQSTGHAKSIKLKTLNEISKSLCKIKTSKCINSGFFLKIPKGQTTIYTLVTSYEPISNQLLLTNKEIEIIPEIGNINQIIKLDKDERKIYCLKNEEVSAIEILEKDNLINKVKFLNYDTECKTELYGKYLTEEKINIFILHYPKGKDLECNCGMFYEVKKLNQFQFSHTLYVERYSSGAPILLFDDKSNKESLVIGVHISFLNGNNIGTFINALTEKILGIKKGSGLSKTTKAKIRNYI